MAITPVSVKDSSGTEVDMAARQDAAGNNIPIHSMDSCIAHYRAGTSSFAPVATPTAAFIITGSATKTVRVKKIGLSGIATAAGNMELQIKKNSAAGTLGSAVLTALTNVPLDSGNAAATAAVSSVGTANYTTLPTLVGCIASGRLQMTADGSGVAIVPTVFVFGDGAQAPVLRGTAQSLTVDFIGDAIPSGGKVDFWVEWAEDDS